MEQEKNGGFMPEKKTSGRHSWGRSKEREELVQKIRTLKNDGLKNEEICEKLNIETVWSREIKEIL